MYLVPSLETVSRFPNPSTWVATAIIDELETLAVECREAAADHRGSCSRQSLESVRSLHQAAETCEEIVQMIRGEYLVGLTQSRRSPVSERPD
nr:hypothetical protein [uncultured Friedmanniella sp.]